MTQPWLKVYPERMLGDAKLSHLSSAEHWWLIVCLHIAANADPYGELRLPSGRPYDAQTLARFLRESARKVDAFLANLVATGIAVQGEDAICFPNLARLQGTVDPGAAERKRRQRERDSERDVTRDSHTESHGASHASLARARDTRVPARAEAEAESRLTVQTDTPSTKPTRRGLLPDLQNIKATDLDPDVVHEIERLLTSIKDKDNGTPGRLVELARRGATARYFADARQGITTSTTNGSDSKKACAIIENALAEA